jgi:hypothetical protein
MWELNLNSINSDLRLLWIFIKKILLKILILRLIINQLK